MNYLIIGDDEYLRTREETKIKEKFLTPDKVYLNYSVYRPDRFDDIMDSLNTSPFLADKRVILVKEAHQLSESALSSLISYLEKSTGENILILSADASLKKSKAFRKLSSFVETIKLDKPDAATIKKWIRTFFKKEGIEISPRAVDLICELKGEDTVGIKGELEKMAGYSGGQRIEEEHVEQLVGRSVTETVFKLTDAINARDADWAFRVLRDLYDQKKRPHEIIGFLGSYLKNIKEVMMLSRTIRDSQKIAQETGKNPWYVKRLLQQSKNYSVDRIDNWISALLETDRSIKTGRKEAVLALEMLITAFLNS
jgi:DNA polymerase-3 subunit delta